MRQLYKNTLLLALTLYYGYEIILGLYQLLGILRFNHSIFALTGSFNNPGPYAGFLAICINVFIPCLYKDRVHTYTSLSLKIQYWFTLVCTAFAVMILPLTQSRSAIVATGCSIILFLVGNEEIRPGLIKIIKKYVVLILAGVIFLGIGAYQFKKPSANGRLFMDKICIKAMCANDWRGAGIGHFGGVYGETQAYYFMSQAENSSIDNLNWGVIDEHDRLTADCPDNAFNEYLFIGVELGPFVMVLFICILVAAIVISFKRHTIWCYGVLSLAVFALFSYPLHVRQFQILLPLMLAGCISDGNNRKSSLRVVSVVSIIVVLLTIIILKIPGYKDYKRAESAWRMVESWHKRGWYDYVVESCDTLLPYMKNNRAFLFAFGQSLNKIGNYEKSDSILKMGAVISCDPMFWNVMGNNSLALGRFREAEERYEHAFYMVPNRVYPLNLLAKLYHTEGDTVRFLKIADKLETFRPKVESENTERLKAEIRDLKAGY